MSIAIPAWREWLDLDRVDRVACLPTTAEVNGLTASMTIPRAESDWRVFSLFVIYVGDEKMSQWTHEIYERGLLTIQGTYLSTLYRENSRFSRAQMFGRKVAWYRTHLLSLS